MVVISKGVASVIQNINPGGSIAPMFPPAFVDFCGAVAPFCAFAVFLAPVPTLLAIRRTGKVGDLPLLPYTSMLMSTFMWTAYGVLKKEKSVYMTNIVGIVLAIGYFFEFVRFAPKVSPTLPGSVAQHGQAVLATVSATILLALSGSSAALPVIGSAAVLLCIAMFASPLAALRTVLQTKSAKAIPLPFTIASIANCFCWTVFGFFRMNDPNIYATNALGLSFGIAQAAVKGVYGDGPEASLPL